jgi:hypothetical protein
MEFAPIAEAQPVFAFFAKIRRFLGSFQTFCRISVEVIATGI